MNKIYNKYKLMKVFKFLSLVLLLAVIASCTTKKQKETVFVEKVETITVRDPGAVEYVWEPPIVDVIKVPPGLDPEGIYYRPAHEEVVEIRQGRWKYQEPQDIKRDK